MSAKIKQLVLLPGENDKETENQDNNDQTISESDLHVYTEVDQNRKPDNSYTSFVHNYNHDEGSVPLFVIGKIKTLTTSMNQ